MRKLILCSFIASLLAICFVLQLAGWDNDKPADNRVWNLAAGDIRDNWDALEVVFGVDLSQPGDFINAKSSTYGATGDGTTNDTVAIQAALDAAEADTDAIKKVYLPAGIYLVDTLFIPIGVTMFGDGEIATTARSSTTLQQSTAGQDVIRFKSRQLASGNFFWFGKLHDFTIYGDTSESTGFGINTKDASGNNIIFEDTSVFRELTIRRMPEGGINLTTGGFPAFFGPLKLLFNNGPGITVTRVSLYQAIHFFDINGDGNNGGLLRFVLLNTGFGNITITNFRSEFAVNIDYSSAERQSVAIVIVNCDNLPLVINGATHFSAVPDGANFKKPGNFIQVTGNPPSIRWNAVAINFRDGDTGDDPLMIGGLSVVSEALYTQPYGDLNITNKMLLSTDQWFRAANTDEDTTPSVSGMNIMLITNSVATVITDFNDGVDGQMLILTFTDGNTKITNGGNLVLDGNFLSVANATLVLEKVSTSWREISRSFTAVNSSKVFTATVDLDATAIKALVGTPKELVAAQGAGTLIEFISAVLTLDFSAPVFAEPTAPDDLAIEYDDGSGQQIITWDTTGFITNNADAIEIVNSASVGGGASAITAAANVNKNIVLINTGGDYTTGASAIRIIVNYKVHTVLGL